MPGPTKAGATVPSVTVAADAIRSRDYLVRVRSRSRFQVAARLALLAGLACGVSACERGCLAIWIAERSGSSGVGRERPRAPADAAGSFDLGGTDCSDGLARCTGGRVEVSVAGHLPFPCAAGEKSGACACAWQAAGTCPTTCLKDGLEVVAAAAVARVQLCAPPEPAARPLLPSESAAVPICADESAACVDGIVRACAGPGQPARLVAACVGGCAPGIGVEADDLLTNDGAAAILCRRAHAERR
jgi:hypothetical protein